MRQDARGVDGDLTEDVGGPPRGVAHRLGEDRVGTCVDQRLRAVDRGIEPLDRPDVGARHDEEVLVASGIGGGSADAAAALRLLARLNGLAPDDPALLRAAAATGADVPVCLASRARIMAGIGERLGPPLTLPPLFALLVNPGVPVETAPVFRALAAAPLSSALMEGDIASLRAQRSNPEATTLDASLDGVATLAMTPGATGAGPGTAVALIAALSAAGNDLEAPARRVAPVIDTVLAALRAQPGCRLARMSGSGATCFALFDDCRASAAAGRALAREQAGWWVKATVLR
jgi:4-diphosphocytidyl-2-C-methyl-D-erythritol kinase